MEKYWKKYRNQHQLNSQTKQNILLLTIHQIVDVEEEALLLIIKDNTAQKRRQQNYLSFSGRQTEE
ncbi:unnamed protein product, partial [Ceratitis capitata]